jgi:hypothetical protein
MPEPDKRKEEKASDDQKDAECDRQHQHGQAKN